MRVGAVSFSVSLATIVAVACSSSSRTPILENDKTFAGTDPTGTGSGDPNLGGDGNPNGVVIPNSCASATYAAKQTPAAMLFVLDKSGTMAQGNKFGNAQVAIVRAMDNDAFDNMELGLLGYPTSNITGPECIFGLPVLCGVSALPQVAVQPAGTAKSNASSGVRREIYGWLASNAPTSGNGDANPTYDALKNGISALQGSGVVGKRILVYITDGGASCASVSSRPGYEDGNGCTDWEYPTSIVELLKAAHNDGAKPVNTMVVGVPGADTHGENDNVPPFSVRLALSSYAAAGSPETIDSTCDGRSFTQTQTDPNVSCHFDMTRGNFTPQALADAISAIRGRLLGCAFDLPESDKPIDKNLVNVKVSTGGKAQDLYRRKDPSSTCEGDGCWDYNDAGKVQLVGSACERVKSSTSAKVEIVVGCSTIIR